MSFLKHTNIVPIVVDIDKDKLVFCDKRTGSTLNFSYPLNVIKDMDLVQKDEFITSLKDFLTKNNINPTDLVFVLSPNLYFEKTLPHITEEDRHIQTKKFLDMIPFESVSSKIFNVSNEYKLVAINRDFYDVICKSFEIFGFKVKAVVPAFVLGPIGVKGPFDGEACRIVLRKMDYLLENSFLTPQPSDEGLQKHRAYIKQHPNIFALISFLTILIALATAFYTLRKPQSQLKRVSPSTTRIVITPTSVVEVAPTPVATPSSQLTVSILNGSGQPGMAKEVSTALSQVLTFNQVEIGNASVSAQTTLVLHTSKVSPEILTQVENILTEFFVSVNTQLVSTGSSDLTITLGKNIN